MIFKKKFKKIGTLFLVQSIQFCKMFVRCWKINLIKIKILFTFNIGNKKCYIRCF